MDIRLKITGGFGGPAAWQELALDENSVSPDQFTKITSALETIARQQAGESPENLPIYPDAQTYEFEFGEKERRKCTVTDASMSKEIRDIVRLIRQQAKDRNNAE